MIKVPNVSSDVRGASLVVYNNGSMAVNNGTVTEQGITGLFICDHASVGCVIQLQHQRERRRWLILSLSELFPGVKMKISTRSSSPRW